MEDDSCQGLLKSSSWGMDETVLQQAAQGVAFPRALAAANEDAGRSIDIVEDARVTQIRYINKMSYSFRYRPDEDTTVVTTFFSVPP